MSTKERFSLIDSRYVVAKGADFIGSNLTGVQSKNNHVIALDNLSTDRLCKRQNIMAKSFVSLSKTKTHILTPFLLILRDINLKKHYPKDMSNSSPLVKHQTNISLSNAMKWLCRAQDMTQDDGVSIWNCMLGWSKSYPETTGYVIPTFFNYSVYSKDIEYFNRAAKMADWELSIQLDNGAFQGGTFKKSTKPTIFNTGQIIFGLIRTYKETKDEKYLIGAIKAGDWLVNVQDDDGSWRRFTYNGITHVYHSRVSWALAELYEICQEEKYLKSAMKNVNWALSNQKKNGWLMNNAFVKRASPFTHTIAYAIRGLLELGLIFEDEKIINAAIKSAESIRQRFEVDKFLYGTYDKNWKSNDRYTCLTGNAQLSIIWQKIYEYNDDIRFFEAALKVNDFLKCCQFKGDNNDLNGGIQGSYPIWGRYMALTFPNWAVKFFVDALLLEEKNKS